MIPFYSISLPIKIIINFQLQIRTLRNSVLLCKKFIYLIYYIYIITETIIINNMRRSINRYKLLYLFTRNSQERLSRTAFNLNPLAFPYEKQKKYINLKKLSDLHYNKLKKQTDQPFDYVINKLPQQMIKEQPEPTGIFQQRRLRIYFQQMKFNINIPKINLLMDYLVNQLSPNSYAQCYGQLINLSKFLETKIIDNSLMIIQKHECQNLLEEIQNVLYKYHSKQNNTRKKKEICFMLMLLNRNKTKKYGEEYLKDQMYWTLKYGINCQMSNNRHQAFFYYLEVYKKSMNLKDYRRLAFKMLCKNISFQQQKKLKEFLQATKKSGIISDYQIVKIVLEKLYYQRNPEKNVTLKIPPEATEEELERGEKFKELKTKDN